MKQFFVKYLPVDGPVIEGDRFIDKGIIRYAMIPNYYNNPHVDYFDGCQKVKLFLCSKDIQVGDTFYDNVGRLWENAEECWVSTAINGNKLGDPDYMSYKVIGEISLAAVWIKEGDEFTEDEIMQQGTGVNITPNPNSIIYVKCSNCKTFH